MKYPFITYREENETGLLCYYIVQKSLPNYVAIVSVGSLMDRLSSVPVGGYNLYVNFNGTIQGNIIPNYKDVLMDIEGCMWQMASWFLNNRVLTEPKKYSKFKISNTDVAVSGE